MSWPLVVIGMQLAYGFPVGSLERGSRLSDVTFGVPSVALDGAAQLRPGLSIGARIGYGATTPRTCGSSSECISSLGHDWRASALVRWEPPRWKSFAPALDLDVGYEWFSSRTVEEGVTATRGYRGPFVALSAHATFMVSSVLQLGPIFGVGAGAFTRTSLEAPGVSTSNPADGVRVHGWIDVGVRGAFRFL
jgi:hypothetical protein